LLLFPIYTLVRLITPGLNKATNKVGLKSSYKLPLLNLRLIHMTLKDSSILHY
jgi:hypothetical protein